jgi:hypothetical protein
MHVKNKLSIKYFWKKNKSHSTHILTMLITLVQKLVVVILLLTKYSE